MLHSAYLSPSVSYADSFDYTVTLDIILAVATVVYPMCSCHNGHKMLTLLISLFQCMCSLPAVYIDVFAFLHGALMLLFRKRQRI